jgi:hypothetical protein
MVCLQEIRADEAGSSWLSWKRQSAHTSFEQSLSAYVIYPHVYQSFASVESPHSKLYFLAWHQMAAPSTLACHSFQSSRVSAHAVNSIFFQRTTFDRQFSFFGFQLIQELMRALVGKCEPALAAQLSDLTWLYETDVRRI